MKAQNTSLSQHNKVKSEWTDLKTTEQTNKREK
jgi:hypothetical protein